MIGEEETSFVLGILMKMIMTSSDLKSRDVRDKRQFKSCGESRRLREIFFLSNKSSGIHTSIWHNIKHHPLTHLNHSDSH